MPPDPITRRLEALEARLAPKCPICGDRSVRIMVLDLDTDEMVSESRPPVCPLCASMPRLTREYLLEDGGYITNG